MVAAIFQYLALGLHLRQAARLDLKLPESNLDFGTGRILQVEKPVPFSPKPEATI